ncbi:uncharacterized protein LOC121235506 [Juglans microcarpa x Juglans regia]|uniref:uncharacterized protein LOC121235506 n=1 Tax=Juglans microcarpa x Juglans regia TaxID=2249226 RepID=UPI001B7E861A|nr:uncharacterized protein LOC121235506 [Juglans microcarpa x Juglans regia]
MKDGRRSRNYMSQVQPSILYGEQVIKTALSTLKEYKEAQGSKSVKRCGGERRQEQQQWKKPVEGTLKANFNAAIDEANQRMGVGVVIRDSEGKLMASCCDRLQMVTQAVVAESTTLRTTAKLCSELGFNRVLFEGDAQVVVNAIRNPVENWTWYGHIIEDVKSVFKTMSN